MPKMARSLTVGNRVPILDNCAVSGLPPVAKMWRPSRVLRATTAITTAISTGTKTGIGKP